MKSVRSDGEKGLLGNLSAFIKLGFPPILSILLWGAIVAPALSFQSGTNFQIAGTVVDAQSGESLPGVNVMVKGSSIGTVTDIDGAYAVEVTGSSAVLVFSFIGYISQEVEVGNQNIVDVKLSPSATDLEEVVVIGYGTQKKSDLTGSVASVDAQSFRDLPMTQFTDMLAGTVAGFNANQGTSAAGGSSLEIRGPTSLNASTEPLIVVDGAIFHGNISDINPNDIESVDILKDASSAAVFGSRAAAGVLMVTTKKGLTGKPKINLSLSLGRAEVTNHFRAYDGQGYIDFRADVMRAYRPDAPSYYHDNPAQLPEGVTLEQWRNASNNPQADNTAEWLRRLNFFPIETENYLNGKTVDWYREVIRPGLRQNYDIDISGGTENISYFWSLGYQDNEGVVRGDRFSAVRSRLNVDFQITDWLNVGMNTQFSDRNESFVKANLNQMYIMSPYGSMYDENGEIEWFPNGFATANPLIDYFGQDKFRKVNTIFSSMYARAELPLGIAFKVSFQPRYSFTKDYNFWSSKTLAGGQTRSNGYATRDESSAYGWMVDNLLTWNKVFGIHQLDVTLLYNIEKGNDWLSSLTNQTFVPNQNLGFHGIQFGTNPSVLAEDNQVTGDAAMARINYTLNDKYIFTGSVRRDGYSAFGIENPRAIFPAAAFAWKISDEKFFNIDFINQLKARASWGVNGNREIGAYAALAQLSSVMYYDGSNVQVGVSSSRLANHSLVWEKTEAINLGLDMGFLDNQFNLSLEVYDMTTTDLLMDRLLPEITGFEDITSNLGRLGNKGFEMNLSSVNMSRSNFTWRSNFVFSLNRNKIRDLFGDYEEVEIDGEIVRREVPDYSNEWFPGEAIDRIWNYDILGIWQEHESEQADVYRLKPGDFKARDFNGNGVYEALDDKTFIGYRQPRYRLGLRNEFTFLKNFSGSVFIRADLGHLKEFAPALRSGGADTYDRRSTSDLPYWTPQNPINDFARLNTNINVFGGGLKIFKPASFVRIQDVSLSYAVPTHVSERAKINGLRIYGSVRNLYSFDKWPGWDPESGTTPMPRMYTLGLNLSL